MKKRIVLLAALTAILSLVLAVSPAVMADSFTDADEAKLTGTDPDEVADILYKLQDLYADGGADALKPAVPALLKSIEHELSIPEDERWNIYDIIKIMSLTGDERIKPLLLNVMATMAGGGNPFTAQGLVNIGTSTIKDVADSLKSSSIDTRGRAAVTLHKMNEFDESKSFFSDANKKLVRDRLVTNLTDENANVRIYSVIALRSFGDSSVVNPLMQIEKHDAHKDSGGTYEVRIEASETLKLLGAK